MEIDLCEMLLKQLDDNMNTIRKEKSNTLKFGSLLVCISFYFQKSFPIFGKVTWSADKPIVYHISEFIQSMGDKFNVIMDDYFSKF